ncbi:MAG: rhodanese-like domain-containing protein [Thiohalocapsa sp.]
MPKRYPILRPLFALCAAFFMAACAAEPGPTLSAPDALAKARAGEITLIDIRTPQEWRQTGIAEGALTIDMTRKTFVEELLNAVDGDKDAPIAIICRTGNRTTYTQKALQQIGFSSVYNVKEGMAGSGAGPGWVRRGLPVESCQTC